MNEQKKEKKAPIILNRFQRFYSQDRYQSSSLRDGTLLNPTWIPLDVQRVFLSLHSKSRANVSRSECMLNRHNCRDNHLQ